MFISTIALLAAMILFVAIIATYVASPPPSPPDARPDAHFDADLYPIDVHRLLWAIAEVENTPNHVIGAKGERSKYQITQSVWDAHSTQPFAYASSPLNPHRQETLRVALSRIRVIRIWLTDMDVPETPRMIALAWGAGINAIVRCEVSRAKNDYADRVDNLYQSTHAHR